jgi:hypothetical protein
MGFPWFATPAQFALQAPVLDRTWNSETLEQRALRISLPVVKRSLGIFFKKRCLVVQFLAATFRGCASLRVLVSA